MQKPNARPRLTRDLLRIPSALPSMSPGGFHLCVGSGHIGDNGIALHWLHQILQLATVLICFCACVLLINQGDLDFFEAVYEYSNELFLACPPSRHRRRRTKLLKRRHQNVTEKIAHTLSTQTESEH